MNLLFDTDNNKATAELKELLGFIDADLKFANIRSKIITATNDVIAVVGLEMYNLAVAEYEKETEKNNDLIFAMRYPIAIQGYRLYAPHNDLSHTNKGRLNRLEDKEKTAFEWMIDKDDKALEKSYYRAMDDLILYLEATIDSWKDTEAYQKTHELFISTAKEFEEYFPIGNSRLLFLKLAPGIRRCEENNIKSRVGDELFNTLKQTPSTNIKLLKKIKEACVYSSMAWAMRRLSVQLFPEGVLQGFVSERMTINAKKSPELNEPYAVAHYFEQDAKELFKEIEAIITALNKLPDEIVEPISFNPDPNDKFLST